MKNVSKLWDTCLEKAIAEVIGTFRRNF